MKVVFNVVLSPNIGLFFGQVECYYAMLERFLGHPMSPTGGQQCIQSREGDGTDNLDTNCKENRNQSIDQKCFHAKILTYF